MKRGGISTVISIAILLGLGIAGVAYWAGRNSTNTDNKIAIVQPSLQPSPVPTGIPTPAAAKTVVIYKAEGSISAEDKTMLQLRVVEPVVDYYKEADQGELVSLTIAPNTTLTSKVAYPYEGDAVLSNGGNVGFLIGATNDEINWWFPECMSLCPLSEGYKLKYPEVAKILGY